MPIEREVPSFAEVARAFHDLGASAYASPTAIVALVWCGLVALPIASFIWFVARRSAHLGRARAARGAERAAQALPDEERDDV